MARFVQAVFFAAVAALFAGYDAYQKYIYQPGPVGAATRLEVEAQEPVTRHLLTLLQVERWLNGATASPNERVKQNRLRGLLHSKL